MVKLKNKAGHILTGVTDIDVQLDGGIRVGSFTVVEGNSKTGKSTLAQYLAYHALRRNHGSVAVYVTRNTVRDFLQHMASLGLPVLDDFIADRLRIYPFHVPEDEDAVLESTRKLTDHINSLPERFQLVVVDAITAITSLLMPVQTMDFLYVCKELCGFWSIVGEEAVDYSTSQRGGLS